MATQTPTTPAATTTAAGTNGLINIPAGGLIQFPTLEQFLGITTVNWTDIALRSGLILLGLILLIVVVAKALSKPAVEITESGGEVGE